MLGSVGVAFGQTAETGDVDSGQATGSLEAAGGESDDGRARGGVEPSSVQQQFKVFALQHLAPDEALDVLKGLFGKQAQFGRLPDRQVVTASGSADILQSIETLIEAVDREPAASAVRWDDDPIANAPTSSGFGLTTTAQGELKAFHLEHVAPHAAMTAIAPLFETVREVAGSAYAPAQFMAVHSRGILIVRAEPKTLEKIAELIRSLDTLSAEEGGKANAAAAAGDTEVDPGQATRTLEATGSLEAGGDAIALDTAALQAVANSIVTVTLKPDVEASEPRSLTGVIIPAREGEPAGGWVVIPYPHSWFKEQRIRKLMREFRNDPEKWDAWWKSKFDGATVQSADWSSTVNYVDAKPSIDLVLLQLAEPDRGRPALALNMALKHAQQQVVVHAGTTRTLGRLQVEYPGDSLPWQIELSDGAEPTVGASVTNLDGQLLGIVARIELNKNIPLAERGGRENVYRMIPARYAEAMVGLQHPGVSENLVNLFIGIAMGKERALIEQHSFVNEVRGERQTGADQDGAQSPDVVGAAPTGARSRTSEGDDVELRLGGGFRGGIVGHDEDGYAPAMGRGALRGGGRGGMGAGGFGPSAEPQEAKVFALKHASTEDTISLLSTLFSGPTTFSSVPAQRMIIAKGPANELTMIEALVTRLDAPPKSDNDRPQTITIAPESNSVPLAGFMGGGGMLGTPLPATEIKLFRLQHLDPTNAVTALSPLFPSGSRLGGGRAGYIAPAPTFVAVQAQRILIVRGQADDLQKIEALLKVLDVPSDTGETVELKSSTSGRVEIVESTDDGNLKRFPIRKGDQTEKLPEAIAALRSEYENRTRRAREIADDLRASGAAEHRELHRRQLYEPVGEAFDARQKLQQAELQALEQRIESMKRTLATRAKIKDEIVQRRVEELLNPALEWDTTANGKRSPASDASAATATADLPTAVVEAGETVSP